MRQIAKVHEWNTVNITDTLLHLAFTNALNSSVLTDIYLPIKLPTSTGTPDDYTYEKIGYTTEQIAEYYDVLYGQNYFCIPLTTEGSTQYADSLRELTRRISAIYEINKPKYLKMAELYGLKWNPLWNVDGVEKYTYLENSGVNDVNNTKVFGQHTDNIQFDKGAQSDSGSDSNVKTGSEAKTGGKSETHEDTNSATSFDSTEFADTEHNIGSKNITSESETTNFNNITDTGSHSDTYGARQDNTETTYGSQTNTDNTIITHHNAKNGNSEYTGGVDGFGNTVVGGDKYHTDIKERHGNIGVTETTKLLTDALEWYKGNILLEFYKDVNKQVLVGIYDLY